MLNRIFHAALVSASVAFTGMAHAYPDKPINIIVPFATGSATDVAARTFAEGLSRATGQNVVVQNRTGAEGAIAVRALLRERLDGYNMLFTSSSLAVLDTLMKAKPAYDPEKDFTPVCTVAKITFLANVSGESPLKTLDDVIATAKAKPGALTFAYSSASTRLAGELFQQAAGVKLMGVPYQSSAVGLTDVGAGRIDFFFIDVVSAGAYYQNGKIRPLVVSGNVRVAEQPDVPTAAEVGIPDFYVAPWFGVYLSSEVPPQIASEVQAAVKDALAAPEMQNNIKQRGLTPISLCGDDMRKFQNDETTIWRRVIANAGITPQ